MVLHLIGLGLCDEKDITVRCQLVHLVKVGALLKRSYAGQESFYGRKVIIADRDMVEAEAETVLAGADSADVAFLVVGDPFGATTHTDIQLRAREAGVSVNIVHNASIMNAVGACGLQLYRYGEAISIVFFTETWRPDSFYSKVLANQQLGLHTLCLLDIQVKEPTLESLARGRKVYQPPRFMTINTAIDQLLEIEDRQAQGAYCRESLCVGMARVGSEDQQIVAGSMAELSSIDFGPPLHCLIIAGQLHHIEQTMVETFRQAS